VEPGLALGGMAVLLDVDSTPAGDRARAVQDAVPMAKSLRDAVDRYLAALPPTAGRQ
jgi:hypothetical protein